MANALAYLNVSLVTKEKGLITFSPFVGIFVTVVTVITIIVFFVLVGSPDPAIRLTAITLGSVTELVLYSLSTSAVLIGIVQVRPRL
jgi:hypothetical protein